MRFSAESLSVSEAGNYFQISFEAVKSTKESSGQALPEGPYLIAQRCFDGSECGRCYVETHDPDYCGHFRLRLNVFSSSCLAFEIERREKQCVEVSFAISATEFEHALPIVQLIFGEPTGRRWLQDIN
jgi:hypothetical protein